MIWQDKTRELIKDLNMAAEIEFVLFIILRERNYKVEKARRERRMKCYNAWKMITL
jgi:hypothetical protein